MTSDIVYFDVVPPMQFAGTDEVRRNFVRWFDGYDGPISLQTHQLTVEASGDVTVAHMLHLDSGNRTNTSHCRSTWKLCRPGSRRRCELTTAKTIPAGIA